MVVLISDPNFTESIWCRRMRDSLEARLTEKRIPFREERDFCPGDAEGVFFIASEPEDTRRAIESLNAAGVRPILLCNHEESLTGLRYSGVSGDIDAFAESVLSFFLSREKGRLALCGINPHSLPDLSRAKCFSQRAAGRIGLDLFQIEGGAEDHFKLLARRAGAYDGIVCVNGFAAVSLILCAEKEKVELPFPLVSCMPCAVSALYGGRILSPEIPYEAYGKAAVDLYELLRKKPYLSGASVKLAWRLPGTDKTALPRDAALPVPRMEDVLGRDETYREILCVENALAALADETDHTVLRGLTEGNTLDQIARAAYLSQNAVKYRVRRLVEKSGAGDRAELVRLWKKIVPPA